MAGAAAYSVGVSACLAGLSVTVDLETLRRDLEANNGMPGLEILRPEEIDAAVRIFYRDGFVVVRDALAADQVEYLRRGCEREAEALVALFPNGKGNRGRYRYSWGAASLTGSILHREEWVMLVDLPTLTPIVTAIFGSADYHVRAARGDFCLPGAIEYAGEAFQDCREIVELLLQADLIAVPRALPGLTTTDKRAGSVYQPSDRAQALMKLEALDSFTGGDSEFTGHRRSVSRRLPQTTTKRAADGTYRRVRNSRPM